MEETPIQNLKIVDRQNLKRKIIKTIRNQETAKKIEEKEILILAYKNKLEENKEKRNQCIVENQKRRLRTNEFEKRMTEYEFEGYVLELEMALLEKENTNTKALYKRLNILYLLLSFYDGVEVMVTKDVNGKKKKLYQKDIEDLFKTVVLEERKEELEMEQKCEQLYMLINSVHNHDIDKNHKFYLDEERKKEMYARILERHACILEVENAYPKIKELQDVSYVVEDFFGPIAFSYERIYKKEALVYKVIKK